MREPLYRQALIHSWKLACQHRFLWIFGLFATLLGQMGILELFSKVTMASSDYALYPKWLVIPKLLKYLFTGFGEFNMPFDGWIWLVWLLLILLGFFVFFVFVSVASQGALIHAAAKSVKHKHLPDVGKSWHVGVSHFWRLFSLNLVKKIVMVTLAVAVGYGALNFIVIESGWGLLLFLVLFLLSILVGMVLSFLVIYAAGYIVVEEYSFLDALEASWKLFISHWLVSIEVGLLVLFLNVVLIFAVLIGFFVLFLPTILTWAIAASLGSYTLYILGVLVGSTLFLFFALALGSFFTVYVTSVWTYMFMKMHKDGVVSRILHWGGHCKK